MKRRFFFPLHLDGGNRGCEAIAVGTTKILSLKREQYIGLGTNINLDKELGVEGVVTLLSARKRAFFHKVVTRIGKKVPILKARVLENDYKYRYDFFLKGIEKEDICMITGGDLLCYGDNEVNYITSEIKKRGAKVVLWGCSVDDEMITENQKETLRMFDAIIARESLTFDYLSKNLEIGNVGCFPDPAFVIKCKEIDLPKIFEKKVVGINLSNFVNVEFSEDSVFIQSIYKMIDYILLKTEYKIVLIPHVFWGDQDDRVMCREILKKYRGRERITYIDTEKMNYAEIRYLISKCSLFIGARTHAVISAYSMCVPTLALGYSIKSKGIAKDIGVDEKLVVDYRSIDDKNNLVERFRYLECHKKEIKIMLEETIPYYKKRAKLACQFLEETIGDGVC